MNTKLFETVIKRMVMDGILPADFKITEISTCFVLGYGEEYCVLWNSVGIACKLLMESTTYAVIWNKDNNRPEMVKTFIPILDENLNINVEYEEKEIKQKVDIR